MAAALRLHLSELNKLVTCSLCNHLMKLATCLHCNHHFCMACILRFTSEEYTSTSGTCCPKCDLPATRRQAIYSPEFDKLVAIYQGLELGLACLRPCCRDFNEQGKTIKKARKKRRRERDAVVSLNQRSACVAEGEKEAVVSLNRRAECVVEGNKRAAVVSSNQRLPCVVEGEKGAIVASTNQRLPCVVEGEKEATVASLNQRLPCVVEGEKEATVASSNQRLPCVVEGEKEAAVVFLNQNSPFVAEGEKEAAVVSLNQKSACAVEGEKEAAIDSLTQKSPRVVDGAKEASGDGVEDPNIRASKKKKKRKREVPYRGHPPMSKRVQLPCPISRGLEEHEKNVSLVQKTCSLQSEVLWENADVNRESLPVVSDGTLHPIDEPETAVAKTVKYRLCLPCEDAKGTLVIGNVIGIMAKQDCTGTIPTNTHGNDYGNQLSKSQMQLDFNPEALAESKPKQKILALDELSCVFCQAPNDSLVAGPMMHYARGVPVQAGRRIKSLVSVHQHCTEWAPNVYYVGDNAKNLGKEVARGQKLKCSQCGLKGAVLGCFVKRCIKSYHYPCARSLSCRWDLDNYLVLCPAHVAESLPCDEPTAQSKKLKNKLKAAFGKLPQLGQNKVDKCNPSGNQTPCTRECKAEKLAAEDIVPSCTNTTRISSRKWTPLEARYLVLCGSGLNSKAHELLALFAKQSGARLTKTWDPRVTHLIIATDGTGAAARTLKFMLATLAGIWILKSDWLGACMAAYQLVGEEPYEVNLDVHGLVGGPRRARLLAASRTHNLLENIEFYFLGDYAAAYKMDLQALVSTAGGRIEDDCWNAEEKMQTCTRVVVYNAGIMPLAECREAVKSRWSQARSVANKARAHIVAHTWILETIAAYELQTFH